MINAVKEKLSINKLVATKKELMTIEGDLIVPDSKPDILNVLCTSGIVSVYKKEIMEGKMKIDGNINTYIVYLSEDNQNKIRGVNINLDFSEIFHLENVNNKMSPSLEVKIKSIEPKIINGRKISVKVILEVEMKIYECDEIDIISQINESSEIQILKEEMKVNSLVGRGETRINAKDTILIDNIDNLAEILKVSINIINRDTKMSYNKILAKAEAELKIMYLTEDNRIKQILSTVPIVGFIDILNVADNNIADIEYEVKNILVKPNAQDEHSIYVEMGFDINVLVYEEKSISLIQDLYSPCKKMEFNRKKISTMRGKRKISDISQIREKIEVEGIKDRDIVDIDVNVKIENESKGNSKIIYDGILEMKFILVQKNGMLDIIEKKIPFTFNINDFEDMSIEEIRNQVILEIRNQDFIVQDGEIVICNIDIGIESNIYSVANINIMDEIEMKEDREIEDYNVIIYIVKKGDTLWEIAKKYGSTVNDIMVINGIEDDKNINIGQKIFIPKYIKEIREKDVIINYA